MIGVTGATLLFYANVLFAGVLGMAAGGLTSLLLRRPWGLKVAVIDGGLSLVVAFISAHAISAIDSARGVFPSRVTLMLTLAVGSVVMWHLLRLAFRSAD